MYHTSDTAFRPGWVTRGRLEDDDDDDDETLRRKHTDVVDDVVVVLPEILQRQGRALTIVLMMDVIVPDDNCGRATVF